MNKLTLIPLLSWLLLANACGSREVQPSSSPSPAPSSQVNTHVNSSNNTRISARINPTLETNDAVLAEVQRLEQAGTLSDVSVMESYPVQIQATGPSDVIQRLQTMASGQSQSGNTQVSFETLSSFNSRRSTAGTEAVSDASAFAALWLAHNGSANEQPSIDFSRQSVLAVFAGQKNTGGYSIRITSVSLQGRVLQVRYSESAPGSDQMVTQVISSPAHLVSIDLSQQAGDFDSVSFSKE